MDGNTATMKTNNKYAQNYAKKLTLQNYCDSISSSICLIALITSDLILQHVITSKLYFSSAVKEKVYVVTKCKQFKFSVRNCIVQTKMPWV